MKSFFQSGDLRIAYLEEGTGEPVLLIHGFASNARVNWVDTGWTRTLADAGYRAIAVDNRGHGESDKPYEEAAYATETMAEDAGRLLGHLGVPCAHVIGYSMGARIGVRLALARSGLVRSLVIGGLGINMVKGMPGARPIAQALLAPSIEDVASPTARTFRAFAEQTGSDLKALAAVILAARAKIAAEDLGRLTQPVLVAVGSEDVIGGSAAELAALIPGAEAFVIEGRDHMKAVGDRRHKEKVIAFLAGQRMGR